MTIPSGSPLKLPLTKRNAGLMPGKSTFDWGVITKVERVVDVDPGIDEKGEESTEFDAVASGTSFTVEVLLMTREGTLRNVPYLFSAINHFGFSGSIPMVNQMALVVYVGVDLAPLVVGGFTRWRSIRRLIEAGILPELRPGEVLNQSSIRSDPMTWHGVGEWNKESGKGARVYYDYKGRLIIESRHYRDGNGAFTRMTFGNPANDEDDAVNDFNDIDAGAGAGDYVVVQVHVAPDEESDPVTLINITQSGKIALQFKKGWFGRAPGEGAEPVTTVEVDVEAGKIIIDAAEIYLGRAAEEWAVMGDTLVAKLESLIDLIIGMRQPVAGAGPTSGPPMNTASLRQLQRSLDEVLSGTSKVE